MTRAPRRIYLYWLLLLGPTLAVGSGAILLLRREQTRLETDAAAARTTHLAAVVGRTRLVAENMDLLVGDVRDALLATLRELPPGGAADALANWPQENPLVRTGFAVAPSGQLRLPNPTEAVGREFVQRCDSVLTVSPPWRLDQPGLVEAAQGGPGQFSSAPEQPGGIAPQAPATNQAASQGMLVTNAGQQLSGTNVANSLNAGVQNGVSRANDLNQISNGGNFYANNSNAETYQAQRRELQNFSKVGPNTALTANGLTMQLSRGVERSGWVPFGSATEASAIVVWLQVAPDAGVNGAELNVDTLGTRLADALPAEFEAGDGYALLDPAGKVVGARGNTPSNVAPAAVVPLNVGLLPGWTVAGYLPEAMATGAGRTLFVLGSLLTGLLVATILASGSLLLWQARASAAEAAQKTSFVANVSHEFKTPLTTIRLYAELLEQGRVRDDQQRAGYLRTIDGETQRLSRLVNQVLDFSSLEQGKKRLTRVPLELDAEMTTVLEAHAPRLAEAGLRLVHERPSIPLALTTDRDALASIVLNLVENACKYAAEGGELTITLAARAGGGAVVGVLDRGPGVPPAHRERIFEQFHRVDAKLTAEKSGAGLGLSIARSLARSLGGDLRYLAREGGGAAFMLELP